MQNQVSNQNQNGSIRGPSTIRKKGSDFKEMQAQPGQTAIMSGNKVGAMRISQQRRFNHTTLEKYNLPP
jgi:hypothetical protein